MFDAITIVPATQLGYVAIGIILTVWVGRTLRIHGRVFLAKGCKGDTELTESLSRLLSVGFYLLHVGCILLTLKLGGYAIDLVEAIELLSTKTGMVLVVLAISHFAHIALYARIHGKPRYANAPASFERVTTAEVL